MLQKAEIHPLSLIYMQPVKKVMSDSQGLVDFAIRLMIARRASAVFLGGNSIYRRIVINSVNKKGFWG